MLRHRQRAALLHVLRRRADRHRAGVRLRCRRQVADRVRQVQLALRQSDALDRVPRRVRQHDRERVGVADIFRCEDDQPPGDEPRVFAAFEHPRQPVERRVGVAAAHALDERRREVVVRIAGRVEVHDLALDGILRELRDRRVCRRAGSSALPSRRFGVPSKTCQPLPERGSSSAAGRVTRVRHADFTPISSAVSARRASPSHDFAPGTPARRRSA